MAAPVARARSSFFARSSSSSWLPCCYCYLTEATELAASAQALDHPPLSCNHLQLLHSVPIGSRSPRFNPCSSSCRLFILPSSLIISILAGSPQQLAAVPWVRSTEAKPMMRESREGAGACVALALPQPRFFNLQ